MKLSRRTLTPASLTMVLTVAAPLSAKTPAYTLSNIDFPVSLHNVEPAQGGDGARGRGRLDVAEGVAEVSGQHVGVVIREYRSGKPTGKAGLRTMAKGIADAGPRKHEVRLVEGHVGDSPTLEQWMTVDTCEHMVVGRVLVALPDKVVELEAAAPVAPGKRAAEAALGRISTILHAVRIHRLADATLDPAEAPPAACEVAVGVTDGGC